MPLAAVLNLMSDTLRTLPLLVVYLTDGCNSKCATCDIWQNPRRNMPPALVDRLVADCQKLQTRWVLLSGGEAMQHPDWALIARKFRAAGVYVMLLTNGLLLRKQATEVIASVDEVIVSLDGGTAATYEAIRGVDAFDLVLEGIRAVRAGGLPVTTRTTVQRANFREIPQIIEVGLALDVNHISFLAVDVSNPFAFGNRFEHESAIIPLQQGALTQAETQELAALLTRVEQDYPAAFATKRIAESLPKLQRILVDYFQALNSGGDYPAPRCNAPHFSTVVDVDGTLRPCYFLPAYGRLLPNGTALPEALNQPTAQALRKAYRSGERTECARCVCPLYKSVRDLWRM